MSLRFFNVLNGKKEEFIPQTPGVVKMYACGITVSDNAHIGHAYQALVFDVIRNYLEFIGNEVIYVRNYTDVDDKIINNARKVGENPKDYAEKFIKKTDLELDALGIKRPTIFAKATDHIDDMIKFISKLIDSGHAYATEDGCVYFDVSSFDRYGEFSNRNIDESLNGVRKELEPLKRDDRDFALWKSAGDDEIFWESPWGKGRPGWHIECSTMSMKYLGETLDIHGGGKDLKFPHHENEIAQSEALTGKRFANYWLHNGLVKINGQKMSKSLGNSIIIEDLIKEYDSDVIKVTLLQNNYRSDLNIMDGMFEDNEKRIYSTYKLFKKIDDLGKDIKPSVDSDYYKKLKSKFTEIMDNDFNTSLAISYVFEEINKMSQLIKKKDTIEQLVNMKYAIIDIYKVLELFQENYIDVIKRINNKYLEINNITEDEIKELMTERENRRSNKDYAGADEIRNQLLERGIVVMDSREGSEWEPVIHKDFN